MIINASNQSEQDQATFINTLHDQHLNDIKQIKANFLAKPNKTKLFKDHTDQIDKLLTQLWKFCVVDSDYSLIAVGGYGRGELYPYSDLDVLILTPNNKQASDDQLQIEKLVGFFWDIGLNVGHSVRTLNECIEEAKLDITTQTNLIECRLLCGSKSLYKHYLQAIRSTIDPVTFFAAKIQEQQNRYAKFNDTAYNLEPNIKESPGGLRDIHSVMWLSRALLIATQTSAKIDNPFKKGTQHIWAWLVAEGILSPLELRQIRQYEKNLQLLRIHLHLLSGRREDRLLFDYQNELANTLGYQTNKINRASEQLMKRYYRSVKFIQVMNEILIKALRHLLTNSPPLIKSINEHFETKNGYLNAKSATLLQANPSTIFEAFLLMQQNPDIKGMSANLLRNLQRVKKLVNHDFRQNPSNKKRFIEILSQPDGVHQALRAMNRYGILGCYLPAFGKIIGQMQHDLFHVYTVDEHILNVLGNLRRYAKPALKHEFPLCTTLFAAFDKPHLLYLGAIFHDIAKGRNGDHSSLGKIDALKFCLHHGLPKEDAELVAWLVSAHLSMSSTAQKSDLSDPEVIKAFAKYVKNERQLIALYLLTVADIRGTSPKVWNAWKARLLENLFHYTSNALRDDIEYTEFTISSRKKEASERLSIIGLKPESYERLWDKFGENYFVRYQTYEICWHSKRLTPHLNTKKPIVRARLSPNGDGIQVMIYKKTQKDSFARICNFFDRMHYEIVEAKIYTTEHGYALNTFTVLENNDVTTSYTGLLKHIERELEQKLAADAALESPLTGRISRQVKHMPYNTTVTITEVADDHHHLLISTSDKPGLLAKIATIFINHEIEIFNAKINTMGDRVDDTFIISSLKGKKLTHGAIKNLKDSILATL